MTAQSLDELSAQFSSWGLAFDEETGLLRAKIATSDYEAAVFLQGAHLAHFRPKGGENLLFLSRESHFESGKPIRGGVPLVFPWFNARPGDSTAPAHGFARTSKWNLRFADASRLTFTLDTAGEAEPFWPYPFRAEYSLFFSAAAVRLRLEIHNMGKVPAPFETAFHTYFHVSDARRVEIGGLDSLEYLDQLTGLTHSQRGSIDITAETDRIYYGVEGDIVIRDPGLKRAIRVSSPNPAAVVWNPWIEKAGRMGDFGDDEWPDMLCIESGAVRGAGVTLEAGQSYIAEAAYTIEVLD